MPLIERDDQLSVLKKLAEEACAARGQVALVTGPAASGRTSLLQAASKQAGELGMLTLRAACAEEERSLHAGVLQQLVDSAPLPAGHLARLRAVLAEIAGHDRAADEEPDAVLLQHYHAVYLILRELSEAQPIVIAVDDVRHADPVSRGCLQALLRRLHTTRILAVLTDDAKPAPGNQSLHTELQRLPGLHRIAVAPLSHQAVGDLIRRQLGDSHALCLTSEFYAASGGNPLLLNALINDFPHSQGYGAAFLSCLHGSDPVARQITRALAVLGDDVRLVPVSTFLALEPGTLQRGLLALNASGLFDEGRFRCEAARTAVLEDTPSAERAALHHRAAEVLHAAGAAAPVVAEHLLGGACAGIDGEQPGWTAQVLLEAAEHALAKEDTAEAAECLELALRAQPHPRAAAAIRARLCQAEWEINASVAARHLAPLLDALRAGDLDQRNGIALVRQLLWHGRRDEATTALELLRCALTEAAPSAVAEMNDLELWLACVHPTLARRRPVPSVSTPDRAGQVLVAPLADPWLQSAAALADMLMRGQSHAAVGRATQVLHDLHIGRHTGWAEESARLSIAVLSHADELGVAAEWSDRLQAQTGPARGRTWNAALAAAQAEIALAQGNLTGAVSFANAATTEVTPKAWGVAIGLILGVAILANAWLGNFEQAAALLAQPVPEEMFNSRYGLYYLYARGQHYLAARHHHAALADFLSCGELARSWGLDTAGIVPWRAGTAEAWLRLGNHEQARRLSSEQLTRPGNISARTRGLSLRLLAAAGPASRRPPLLLESLDLLESCGDRFEQARTLADLANAYNALSENRRARTVFRRAVHMARICQAEPLCRELLSVGGELGNGLAGVTGADGVSSLTDSERRVASLAAIGYTNREIARKLYITASTVEQHLTRVYRKLNVKHRRELPMDLSVKRPPA